MTVAPLISLKMRPIFFPLSFLILFLSGCNSYNSTASEELDRLTKEDPQFKEMMDSRNEAHRQIRAVKGQILEKKKVIDAKVSQLRKEYDAYVKENNITIEKYRSTIEANRNVLRREIEAGRAKLAAMAKELDGYQKTLGDVRKVISNGKGIDFSAEERKKWEERVLLLSEKIKPLADAIEEAKLSLRLKEQKMNFLK